jgi:hypothetical protein
LGEVRNSYKILVKQSEGTVPFGRHRCGWEDNTEMDLKEIGCESVDWMEPVDIRV